MVGILSEKGDNTRMMNHVWHLNTSNPGKLQEYHQLFEKYGFSLESTQIDLAEIKSDPVKVVVHKASQVPEGVLVDDTSLDIEGIEVGINVRWFSDLSEFAGKKARWRVLLAYRSGDKVHVFEGVTYGSIVQAKGDQDFGFDAIFLPDGTIYTLAEKKPDAVNARAKAVEALIKGKTFAVVPSIDKWDGAWQQH